MTDQHVDSTAINDYIEMLSTEIKSHREYTPAEESEYYDGIIAGLQYALTIAEDYLWRL